MHRAPALLSGLGFLVGIALALTHNAWFALPLLPLLRRPRFVLSALVPALLGIGYALMTVSAPQLERQGVVGSAHLHLERIVKGPRGWQYQGHLKRFEGEGVVAKNLPIRWSAPFCLEGTCDYTVSGKLTQKGRYYRLQPTKGASWEKVSKTHSLAKKRYETKSKVRAYLSRHLSKRSTQFLSALVTSDLIDSSTLFDFSRLGLSHLMAISGFHFSLLALFIGLLLRPFLPYKLHAILAALLLSLYFGFIGCTPSILRAHVMALMGLTALVIERTSSALNALGSSLIVVLLIDPYSIFSIGFQFSFLCTGCLVAFYPPCERFLQKVIPTFRKEEVWKMSCLDQHGFILATLIRRALALSIAVNIGALPLTLFVFHVFPLIGLVCNLFFPALIALTLFLLPFAAATSFLFPWGGKLLFSIEEYLVQGALDFTHYLPAYFDFQWVCVDFPLTLLLGLLALLLGAVLHKKLKIPKRKA